MTSPKPITADAETLRGAVTGKHVASVQILGINSLKSLHPPLESLRDQKIADIILDDDQRKINLVLERHVIVADMARTGTIVVLNQALAWKPSEKVTMPTARIIFSDGSALDFKEPGKTKRISFTVKNIDVD